MNIDNNFQTPFKHDMELFGERPFGWDKNPEKKEDRELDIECICGHCILRIFEDNYYKEPTYNFAVYSNRPSSFWRRIKKAWKFVWKGEQLLLEDLELTKEDFKTLKEFTDGR